MKKFLAGSLLFATSSIQAQTSTQQIEKEIKKIRKIIALQNVEINILREMIKRKKAQNTRR